MKIKSKRKNKRKRIKGLNHWFEIITLILLYITHLINVIFKL